MRPGESSGEFLGGSGHVLGLFQGGSGGFWGIPKEPIRRILGVLGFPGGVLGAHWERPL